MEWSPTLRNGTILYPPTNPITYARSFREPSHQQTIRQANDFTNFWPNHFTNLLAFTVPNTKAIRKSHPMYGRYDPYGSSYATVHPN
jgi:hypothetical protein